MQSSFSSQNCTELLAAVHAHAYLTSCPHSASRLQWPSDESTNIMIDGKVPHEGTNHFASDKEWQDIDYWYNRVVDAKNPASNTANPSALALITFGLTTALLQVLNKPYFRSTALTCLASSVVSKMIFGKLTLACVERCKALSLQQVMFIESRNLSQGANTHWTGMSTQYATVGFMVFFGKGTCWQPLQNCSHTLTVCLRNCSQGRHSC